MANIEHINHLYQLNRNGDIVNVFDSVAEAAKRLGIHRSLIYQNLQGKVAWTHSFCFLWEDDYNEALGIEDEPEDEPEEKECEPPVQIRFNNGICVCIPAHLLDIVSLPDIPGHTSMEYQPEED